MVSSLQKDIQAVIAWGWDKPEFYIKWMGDNDPLIIRNLIGPALNPASPQSDDAPALLNLFRNVLLKDTVFLDRIKRHYAMFREKIDNKPGTAARKKQNRP